MVCKIKNVDWERVRGAVSLGQILRQIWYKKCAMQFIGFRTELGEESVCYDNLSKFALNLVGLQTKHAIYSI